MLDFIKIFLRSDYAERDPRWKLLVGLGHAWAGGLGVEVLVRFGFTNAVLMLVIAAVIYALKEICCDIIRRSKGSPLRWVMADSVVDWSFVMLGAYAEVSGELRYSFGVLSVGAAYFIFGTWRNVE